MKLNARGALCTRILPSGRVLDVLPLVFGRARLLVSQDLETLCAEDVW